MPFSDSDVNKLLMVLVWCLPVLPDRAPRV